MSAQPALVVTGASADALHQRAGNRRTRADGLAQLRIDGGIGSVLDEALR